jgi:hypothetical protein
MWAISWPGKELLGFFKKNCLPRSGYLLASFNKLKIQREITDLLLWHNYWAVFRSRIPYIRSSMPISWAISFLHTSILDYTFLPDQKVSLPVSLISEGLRCDVAGGGTVGWGTADTSRKAASSIPNGIIHWLKFSRVDSTSNRNEYQGYLVEGKDGWCVGLTNLPSSCNDYLESLGASYSWNPDAIALPFRYVSPRGLVNSAMFLTGCSISLLR